MATRQRQQQRREVVDPHQPPEGHAAAMQYLRQHPGLSYEAAVQHVGAESRGPLLYDRQLQRVQPRQSVRGPVLRYDMDADPTIDPTANPRSSDVDPHAEPADYREILAWLRAHPGCTYDQAVAHVRGDDTNDI